ncbi:MAG: hypothetical protein MJB12_10055 [Firmicutes bacterium]|nr:hypothetical protein [Bacillota bacterium]
MHDLYPRDFECILVDKVFDSCLKKVCFDDIKVKLPEGIDPSCCDIELRLENGEIKSSSLKVIDSMKLPEDCKRVKFIVVIKGKVIINCNGKCFEIPITLPKIPLDIILYYPDTRPEFSFDLVIETRGELLDEMVDDDGDCSDAANVTLAIGVFIVAKVVGKVQLRLDCLLDYCVPPRECKDFTDASACDDFDAFEFPADFFPPQATSIYPCDEVVYPCEDEC